MLYNGKADLQADDLAIYIKIIAIAWTIVERSGENGSFYDVCKVIFYDNSQDTRILKKNFHKKLQ